jgi:hypothetical protein
VEWGRGTTGADVQGTSGDELGEAAGVRDHEENKVAEGEEKGRGGEDDGAQPA